MGDSIRNDYPCQVLETAIASHEVAADHEQMENPGMGDWPAH